jgi:predicted NAD-dependent protein-ADP-ribosyltransferase YbiA (DUF1768 family)
MSDATPTWRRVDGDVIPGRQRLIFVRSRDVVARQDRYALGHLAYFADGAISWHFGPSTDLDGLREAFEDGTLTLTPPEGTVAILAGTAAVTLASVRSWLTPDSVIHDIVDELDRLNDRPDSSGRCWDALMEYADEPTEANLAVVRERYLAVPEHRRIYVLGDMDRNDVPVRILLAEPGESIPARNPDIRLTVTSEVRADALEYFRRTERAIARVQERRTADGPETAAAPPYTVPRTVYPNGWPDPPGPEVLQNDYPATVVHGDREYQSVTHAYWALSTSDPDRHDTIAAAERGHDAELAAEHAPRREAWSAARLAVMGTLLRDKYHRHPEMAATLLATGDARILYQGATSRYWDAGNRDGTNWVGRLLEIVRSELAAKAGWGGAPDVRRPSTAGANCSI